MVILLKADVFSRTGSASGPFLWGHEGWRRDLEAAAAREAQSVPCAESERMASSAPDYIAYCFLPPDVSA